MAPTDAFSSLSNLRAAQRDLSHRAVRVLQAMQRRDDDLYSSMDSMASRASRSLNTGGAAGVGIFFQQESDGKVYVKTIVSGGSAERDGLRLPASIVSLVSNSVPRKRLSGSRADGPCPCLSKILLRG